MKISHGLTIVGWILVGILSRLIPHLPNFTALTAIALCGSLFFEKRQHALLTALTAAFLSDILLGFHSTMPYVYGSYALVALLGFYFRSNLTVLNLPVVSISASCLFFLITNFGVWLHCSLYALTFEGLGICYVAALPFLLNQIAGDAIYSLLLVSYALFLNRNFTRKDLSIS